jgi:hypothetical protein
MTPQKQNKEMTKSFYVLLMLIPVFMFGVLGAGLGLIGDNSNPLSGFLWGVGIGVALCVAMVIGMFGWEWIKKEADKGKLYPYILIGFLVAIAISGFLAINLGNPSCEESSEEPYSSCTSYADDGFEATDEQRWQKFWGTLPVTAIITSLVAVIVRNEMEKNKKK